VFPVLRCRVSVFIRAQCLRISPDYHSLRSLDLVSGDHLHSGNNLLNVCKISVSLIL
jgi:hypothetical protein